MGNPEGLDKIMFMIHKHNWKIEKEFYSEPRDGSMENISNTRFCEKVIFGFSTIIYKCEKCDKREIKEIIGKEVK